MGAKYDPQAEAEVRHWFKQLLNEDIGDGSMTVEKNLKDGILLIKYVRNTLPPAPSITFTKKNPRNINYVQFCFIKMMTFINFISCKYKRIYMSLICLA